MYKTLCLVALSVFASVTLLAQTLPSGEGGGITGSARIGAEISTFNPDYGCLHSSPFSCWNNQLFGIAPFVDTREMFFSRMSVEGQARFLHWRGPGKMTQSSYMVGPRVRLFHYHQAALSGKMLFGTGHLSVTNGAGSGTYLAYAPGAVVEYRVMRRLFVRADYEEQMWPGFKGVHTSTTNGTGALTPNGLSLGVSYAIQ